MISACGLSKESMAVHRLDHSFNDSLESAAKCELGPAAQVAPEGRNGETDFQAFSKLEEEDGDVLYLGLLPYSVFSLLQDKGSGRNRALGVTKLQAAVESARETFVLESNLSALIDTACAAVSDSHIKVSLAGLQLMACLISRLGRNLFTYLPQLVPSVLAKMGTNKYVLKQAGMQVLVSLMRTSKPALVVNQVANFGLKHKQSKVREESLNVVTASLILFPKSVFQLITLARDVFPTLNDAKPKVRQAGMESAVVIASLCDEMDFKQIVSLLAKNSRSSNGGDVSGGMDILEALNCRLVRGLCAKVKEDGMVEYGMPVVGVDIPFSELGPDVEWIREGQLLKNATGGSAGLNVSNGLMSSVAGRESKFRPYRSASKRLPWELEEEDESKATRDTLGSETRVEGNESGDLNSTHILSKSTKPLASLTHPRPPSSKVSPQKDGNSPPQHRPPTGRQRAGVSYTGIQSPKRTLNPSLNGPPLLKNPHDMPPTPRGPLPPPIPPPNSLSQSTSYARRHKSLPNGVNNGELRTRNGFEKNASFQSGSPQRYPVANGGRAQPPLDPPHQTESSFSETWPRSRGGIGGLGGLATRTSEQITADPMKAVGEVHDSVRTNVFRPPSKPRVRNPLTYLQQQEEKKIKSALLQQQQQQLLRHHNSPQDSPTLTEREFLMGSTTLTGEEDYYSMVPEDNTILDNSLSSSLTSLCRTARDAETAKMAELDSLKHIREKAASRKAQLLSAECSVSNSPEYTHSPPLHRSPGEEGRKERAHRRLREKTTITEATRKWKSDVGLVPELNKTYIAGQSSGPHGSSTRQQHSENLTQTVPASVWKQRKRETREREVRIDELDMPDGDVITLEGQSLDQERNAPPLDKEQRHKRRSKRLEGGPPMKPRVGRAVSLGPEGQRPSIEKGGTNTIMMEVSGVGSPPPQPLTEPQRDSDARRKRRKRSDPTQVELYTGDLSTSHFKPPLPPTMVMEEDKGADVSSQQHLRPRKKHSKYAVKGREEASGHHNGRRNSLEGAEEGGSPGHSKSNLVDLQPFLNPDQGLRESLDKLASDDWNDKCVGLLGVRRLAMFHVERVIPNLRTVVRAVQQEAKNLRSSVSRAAIACLGDLFALTGRAMEPELDGLVKILLHKTGESNIFIREDVDKALSEMVYNVSPHRALTSIIAGGLTHRNTQVRRTASQFLCLTVEHAGPDQLLHTSKDILDRTLVATLQLIGDAAAEPRYFGRKCLSLFLTVAEFEKVASRTLTSQQWSRMRDVIEQLRTKGVGDPPTEASSARSRHPPSGSVRASSHVRGGVGGGGRGGRGEEGEARQKNPRRATQVTNGENPSLPERLVERLRASNWEERLEAVADLEQFVDTHPKALGPHLHKVFDVFNLRLTDRNSKVNLAALQAFSNMVPLLGNTLTPVITNVITALLPNLASKNATIHSTAMTVFELISQCVDPTCLIQPIATHSQHGNARVQPIMIRKLGELTQRAHSQNPKLVTRQVLPVMWHLLSSKPPGSAEARAAIVGLCEALFNSMGQSFVDSAATLPPASQKRLDQILNTGNVS